MITFYFVCKNGSHEEHADETMEKFEINTDYKEGLKMLRCIIHIFDDFIKTSKKIGRTL